jgi:hypothetical protein
VVWFAGFSVFHSSVHSVIQSSSQNPFKGPPIELSFDLHLQMAWSVKSSSSDHLFPTSFPPRPPARENNDPYSAINSPRRLLFGGPRKEEIPMLTIPLSTSNNNRYNNNRRRKKKTSPRLKPVASPRRLTGGLDGDARNMHFLKEMLSVVGGLDQIEEDLLMPSQKQYQQQEKDREEEQQQRPQSSIATAIIAQHKVSPRQGKVYTREDTFALQQALGKLVNRSRKAVIKMNNTLHLQATNQRLENTNQSPRHALPSRDKRKRILTADRLPNVSSTLHSPRANTRIAKLQRERPGTPASLSILETALSVAQEARAWDVVTCEIVRQIHNDCKERGVLLNFIRLRNKQTTNLLLTLCKTQQSMLENFSKRQNHMIPRTKTVEKIYKKKKREQEVNEFTDAIKKHQMKLEQARARIQRLSNDLVYDVAYNSSEEVKDSDHNLKKVTTEFEAAMAEQEQQKIYERSKFAFSSLLSDLSKIERESNRFRNTIQSKLEDGLAAREALEQHRSFVQAKIHEKEILVKTTLLVQAHWRGYRARKTDVVAARLAYTQRQIQKEAIRLKQLRDGAKLKIAKWSYRQYQIWDMKCKMNGLLAKDREKRKLAARRHHHHTRKKYEWYDFYNACKKIQKAYRHHLWQNESWRRKWLRRIVRLKQDELLDSITDDEQKVLMKRTIALSIQEHEQQYITRLHAFKNEVDHLNRRIVTSDKLAKKHYELSENKVNNMKKMVNMKMKKTIDECDNKLREKQIVLHQLAHALEATKVKHTNNAKKRVNEDSETATANYVLDSLRESINKILEISKKQSKLESYFFKLEKDTESITNTSNEQIRTTHSRQGEILTDPSNNGNDVYMNATNIVDQSTFSSSISIADAFKFKKIQNELNDYRNSLLKTMKDIRKSASTIEQIFLEQDHERKMLVLRNVELEKELHSFDPGHQGVIHHDLNHRSHHLNRIRNERDNDSKGNLSVHHKSKKQKRHALDHSLQINLKHSRRHSMKHHVQPHHQIGHDYDKSFAFESFDEMGNSSGGGDTEDTKHHPMILPVKENGELDLDAHTRISRRRPSVLRAHKTTGLF